MTEETSPNHDRSDDRSATGRHLWLVLHGKAAVRDDVRRAVEGARRSGHRLEVRVTWEAGDGQRYARQAVEAGADTVVAGGGDGTLNEVVRGVLEAGGEEGCSVGILPLGTGNDFARACGLPDDDPGAALDVVLGCPPQPIDLGLANDRVFVNVATGGVGSEITRETSEPLKETFGRLAYLLTGLARYRDVEPAEGRIEAPDRDWEGSFYALVVGNSRYAGGGLRLLPEATVDDGLLDVLLVPEEAEESRARAAAAILRQERPQPEDAVKRFQVPWIEVTVPGGLQVNLDGEPMEDTSFRFEVSAGRLRFHLEEGCPLRTQGSEGPPAAGSGTGRRA